MPTMHHRLYFEFVVVVVVVAAVVVAAVYFILSRLLYLALCLSHPGMGPLV